VSEANEDITNQPADGPRRRDFTNEPPRGTDAYEPEQTAPPKSKTWLLMPLGIAIPVVFIGVTVLLSCCVVSLIALLIPAVQKVREAAARTQSMNNCKQMGLAVNSIADMTPTGNIPPSYGTFPAGSTTSQSYFVSLLPYIEQGNLYNNWASSSGTPVKTYIAPADPYNPGTSGLISYGSNATVLTVGGQPTFPKSFNGRTSGVIVVFERTAKSGATWSSSTSYLIDKNGSSSPEFTDSDSWSGYGTKATVLNTAGCVVGMADGSARIVTKDNASAGWSWAMDPSINSGQPAGW
jgi:hypothetical protein